MLQSQAPTASLFRTSLRDWQASWKARQAAQASQTSEPPAAQASQAAEPLAPPRVKKLIAHKKRKQKRLAAAAQQ